MFLFFKKVGKGDEPDRKLLDEVWGEIPPTETTAIMGASGAGKSSLLNLLSGRARTSGRLRIDADVRLDNYTVDPTDIKVRKSIAFVAQDDSLQHTATPREAIKFSAKLRLPRSTTDASIDKLVNRMLKELGLSACADTIVGGPLIKGISGGERKRTSVGVELVVKPSMVFLDEPVSVKNLLQLAFYAPAIFWLLISLLFSLFILFHDRHPAWTLSLQCRYARF
jgi:ABC-type multidrug transport system ATPase subunit